MYPKTILKHYLLNALQKRGDILFTVTGSYGIPIK